MATDAEAVARVLAEPWRLEPEYAQALSDLTRYSLHSKADIAAFIAYSIRADRSAQRAAVLEEAARVVERRIEERFREHGTTEWDTGATYYGGSAGEMYDALDEEAIEIAKGIRALAQPKEPAE